MTDWSALNVFYDILITYYFGSPITFYTSLVALFMILLVIAGLDFRFATIFSIPIVLAFTLYGVWGDYTWIGNLLLIVVGIIYAYAIIDMYT